MRLTAALSLVLGAPLSVGFAQVAAGVEVGSGVSSPGMRAWQRESQFAPTLSAVSRLGYLRLDGVAAERGGRLALRSSTFDAAVSPAAFGVFRLTFDAHAQRDAFPSETPAINAQLQTAISARLGAGGAWTGVARDRRSMSTVSAGLWRVFGGAIFTTSTQRHEVRVGRRTSTLRQVTTFDSVYTDTSGWQHYPVVRTFGDSGSSGRLERWTDLETRMDWARGRLMLSASMSARPMMDSTPAQFWGRVNAAVQLNPRVSFVLGGGSVPSTRAIGDPSSRFVTLGFRLSPATLFRPPLPPAVRTSPSAFNVQAEAGNMYRIVVRVPHARTVDLAGDFNGWLPIALREAAPDVWEVSVPLSAGTHRVSLRVDGDAWTAPPGVPAVDDEFNGRVGIVVVR